MTNEEKYTTPEERTEAHRDFCLNHDCSDCPASKDKKIPCPFTWLALEAEEEGEKNNDYR